MADQEPIQKLQDEVAQLTSLVHGQQQQIDALQRKLSDMHTAIFGKPDTYRSTSPLSASRASLEQIIGLRLIHIVGIVVLVIGLSLGVKYAIDKNLISEAFRIGLAYAAGLTLYSLSVRLRRAYTGFSAILFSGGMASIYFTTYGACIYYQFISYPAAFAIMIALTVFAAYQALLYNRQEIALLGLVGAYGIPFLISPNNGHPESLFLYISIINAGVVFICARKPWVLVGRIAQLISWMLFIGWVALQNDERLKSYGLLFMLLFFFLFSLNALSGKLFRKEAFSRPATYQLLFNNVLFYIAALYVFGYSFADSTVALITLLFSLFAAIQIVLFYFLNEQTGLRSFTYYALTLFIVFIAFQWNGLTVTLLWILTAVVIFCVSVWLKSTAGRMGGIGLIGLTLVKLVAPDSLNFTTLQKVIAYLVLGALLLVVSFFYQKTAASSTPRPPSRPSPEGGRPSTTQEPA